MLLYESREDATTALAFQCDVFSDWTFATFYEFSSELASVYLHFIKYWPTFLYFLHR